MNISVDEHYSKYRLVLTDTTKRKRAEVKLQLAASVFTSPREGIMKTNANETII
jgi:hypothetical protein